MTRTLDGLTKFLDHTVKNMRAVWAWPLHRRISTYCMRGADLLWCTVAILALSAPCLCLAAADVDLKPIPERSALWGRLGAVGVVMIGDQRRGRSLGTGFLVSSCHVLTARHVLAAELDTGHAALQVRFIPTMGSVAVELDDRAVLGKVVAAGPSPISGEFSRRMNLRNAAQDWALIELDHPIGYIEPYKILYPGATLTPGIRVSAVGYAASSRILSVNVHERCTVRPDFRGGGRSANILIADCAVRSGMSGGPLLIESSLQPIAVGIIVERVEVGDKVATVAVATQSLAERIGSIMRSSQVCAVGQPFAFPPAYIGSTAIPATK